MLTWGTLYNFCFCHLLILLHLSASSEWAFFPKAEALAWGIWQKDGGKLLPPYLTKWAGYYNENGEDAQKESLVGIDSHSDGLLKWAFFPKDGALVWHLEEGWGQIVAILFDISEQVIIMQMGRMYKQNHW